jgi:radical SAM-linked protein
MRLRITFAKNEAVRYIGHLDLHRTWERTLRRAGLPLSYSQGFSPHPKINLASALPLGFTSQCEVVDIWLDQELPLDQVHAALQAAIPPGLVIQYLEQIPDRAPTLQTILQASEYEVTLLDPVSDLEEKMERIITATSLPRQRRGKTYDLRPIILDLKPAPSDQNGLSRFTTRLAAREGATGRPEEILAELGVEIQDARVHRLRLIFSDQP